MPKKETKENKKEYKEKTKKEENEESELEEKIEEAEEITEDSQFHEFLKPPTETFSPVLERVETPQQESLEDNMASISTFTSNEDERKDIDYPTTSNEIIYNPSRDIPSIDYQPIRPSILTSIRTSEDLPRQEFLDPLKEMRIDIQDNFFPEIIDTSIINQKTRLPFEKEDKKYKEI